MMSISIQANKFHGRLPMLSPNSTCWREKYKIPVVIHRHNSSNSEKKNEEKSFFDNKEVWTIPNIITMSRIAASPGISMAIAYDMKEVALGGCLLFAFSDWLDGYIARKYNQATVLGAFIDPVADKVMIAALAAGLTAKSLIPFPLFVLIVGRDVILIGASFYIRAKERPPNTPFFDTTYSATFQIVPSDLSKLNTGIQFLLVTLSLINFTFDVPRIETLEPLWWITAITTSWSGLDYIGGSGLRRLSKANVGRGNVVKKE